MEDQQKSIDEIFRQSLGDYREAPPAAAWDDVASKLDGAAPPPAAKRYFMRWPWISLLLLLVAGSVWLMVAKNGGNKKTASSAQPAKPAHPMVPAATNKVGAPDTAAAANGLGDTDQQEKEVGRLHGVQHPGRRASKPSVRQRATHTRGYKKGLRPRGNMQGAAQRNDALRNDAQEARRTANSPGRTSRPLRVAARAKNDVVGQQEKNSEHSHNREARSRQRSGSRSIANRPPTNKRANKAHEAEDNNIENADVSQKSVTPGQPAREAKSRPKTKQTTETRQARTETGKEVPKRSHNNARATATPDRLHPFTAKSNGPGKKPLTTTSGTPAAKRDPGASDQDDKRRKRTVEADANKHRTAKASHEKTATSTKKGVPNANAEKPVRKLKADKISEPQKPAATENRANKPNTRAGQDATTSDAPKPKLKQDEETSRHHKNDAGPQAQAPATPNNAAPTEAAPVTTKKTEDENEEAEADNLPEEITEGGGGGSATHPVRRHRRGWNLSTPLSLDLLAGYEWGLQQPAPNKGVFALRFSWHLNTRISIGIIPAYRFGSVASQQLSEGGTFGNVNPVQVDSMRILDTTQGFQRITYTYKVTQSYDSILVPGSSIGGKIWELELPLVLNVQAGHWRFYGGPSFNFGGRLNVSLAGPSATYQIRRSDSLARRDTAISSSTFNNYFGTNLTPYAGSPNAQNNDPSMRIGYTVGIGYQYRGFLIDLSLHQQLTGYGNVAPDLKKVYSSPNFRINIGYRLFGPRPMERDAATEKNFIQRL